MKKILLIIIAVLPLFVKAQQFTSNLPIIMIYTDTDPSTGKPYTIPDEPKVPGRMIVLWHKDGSRTSIADVDSSQYIDYSGQIGIERRGGGTTQNNCNKKNYGVRTLDGEEHLNVSLLGLPKEHDWCLQGSVFEPSLIRDVLTYDLSRAMGHYAPRCVYCEVFLNDKYVGLYFLTEKIKVDGDRVNVEKMEPADTGLKLVSGGHLIVADHHHDDKEPYQWSLADGKFFHESPKSDEITKEQHQYIVNYMNAFNDAAMKKNHSIINGYPALIDLPSFVDYVIINELSSNTDGYRYSTFMHKERNGKLYAGPVWDYNCAYGLDFIMRTEASRSTPEGWQYSNPLSSGDKPKFWTPLVEDSLFQALLVKRWNELTQPGQILDYDSIMSRISEYEKLLNEAAPREIEKWKGEKYYHVKDHYSDLQTMKEWLKKRIAWISSQWTMPDSSAFDVQTPPIVISKIHYHPEDKNGYDQDELEFIGISNIGDDTVDLTGFYFPVLGMSYLFPNNSVLLPHREIYLASNADAFKDVYGVEPFGEYTRHLSNSSEQLMLTDAYGNVIDEVEYMDKKPWPKKADGDGYYLRLLDLESDNNIGENWTASDDYNLTGMTDECLSPYDLQIDTMENQALISWKQEGSADLWEFNYKMSSEEEWLSDTTDQSFVELTGLTYNTQYNARVRCLCAEDRTSTWTEMDFVTPNYECLPPVALTFSDITKSGATAKWKAANYETIWILQYKALDDEDYADSVTVTDTVYVFTQLQDSMTYNVRVRSACNEDRLSAWTEGSFTTEPNAINDFESRSVRLYPNPTTGKLTCDLRDVVGVERVDVYDVYGRLMQSSKVNDEIHIIDASGYADGLYLVRICTKAGAINRTFVKK